MRTPPPLYAQLSEIVQFVNVDGRGRAEVDPPPPPVAEFDEIVQLVSVGEDSHWPSTPPPSPSDVFPVIVQLRISGDALFTTIPPEVPRVTVKSESHCSRSQAANRAFDHCFVFACSEDADIVDQAQAFEAIGSGRQANDPRRPCGLAAPHIRSHVDSVIAGAAAGRVRRKSETEARSTRRGNRLRCLQTSRPPAPSHRSADRH